MKYPIRISLISAILLTMVGCASTTPVEVVEPAVPENNETIQAFNQIVELKEELKQLRNKVEELLFNHENTIRQQRAQISDLQQRIDAMASTPQVSTPTIVDQSGGQNTGVSAVSVPSVSTAGAANGQSPQIGTQQTTPTVETVTVVETSPTSPPQPNVTIPSGDSVSLSEQESYDRAFDLLKRSLYEDAIVEFQYLANTWPQGGLADDAYYWISEARYVNREFEDALTGFRTVVTRYPDIAGPPGPRRLDRRAAGAGSDRRPGDRWRGSLQHRAVCHWPGAL